MKRRFLFTLLTTVCFAALFACCSSAAYWVDRTSPDCPVYPQTARCETGDLDGNGLLEPADARSALRASVGLEWDNGGYYATMADIDGDGDVTPADARQILRYAVGLDGYTPPTADGSALFVRLFPFRISDLDASLEPLLPLTVNGAQPGDRQSGERLPLWRLRSAEEAENFVNEMEIGAGIGCYTPAPPLKELIKRYDAAFFEKYDLYLCAGPESCSSTVPALYPPSMENGALTITFGSVGTVFQTPDVVNRMFFIPIRRSVLASSEDFRTATRKGVTLTSLEYDAAKRYGQTRWEFADAHRLQEDAAVSQLTGSVYYVALPTVKNGALRWVCETDCEIREYRPTDLRMERNDGAKCIYLREESVTAPGDDEAENAEMLQIFMIGSPDAGDYTLRFRQVSADGMSASEDAADERSVRLTVKAPEPVISNTFRWATENGAVATSSEKPFNLNYIILGYSTLMGEFNNCRFRGVIERIDRYQVSWKTADGEESGPYPRAILKVRVTQNYRNLPGREYVNILYVYDPDEQNAPVTVRTGQEYLFVDCRLIDEDYMEKAAAVLPDFVKNDDTLLMADVIAGPAKYTFIPVDGENCTVYREYFSEEQLRMKGEPPTIPWHPPFYGADYVTIDLESMEDYLINLESRRDDMFS